MKKFQYTKIVTVEIETPDEVTSETFLDWLAENDDSRKAGAVEVETFVSGFVEVTP